MKSMNNEAVSPILGIVVMVAVLVILAAIVAMYVLGASTAVSVFAVAVQNNDTISVVYNGGPDEAYVRQFEIVYVDQNAVAVNTTPLKAGDTFSFNGTDGKDHIQASVIFFDGSKHRLLDTYV